MTSKDLPQVFISAGSPRTAAQDELKAAAMRKVRELGFAPRSIGNMPYDSDRPYKSVITKIDQVMNECSGVIIIAYERMTIASGRERVGMNAVAAVENAMVSTPWNQCEAAMAHTKGLPILILCQDGLRQEGLLENEIIAYVQRVPISAQAFEDRVVLDRMIDWSSDVRSFVPVKDRAPKSLGQFVRAHRGEFKISIQDVFEVIKTMPISTLWKVGGAAVSAGVFIFWIGARFG